MNFSKFTRMRGQQGWSLVEMAVVLACVALMGLGAVSMLNGVKESDAAKSSGALLERAGLSLAGSILLDPFHLPEPVEAVASPDRPGYVEGWLPAGDLGLPASRRIRYLVDATLTRPPAVFKPDPLGLAGPGIATRTSTNGLDFCAALMARELTGAGLPGGLRAAFALQIVDDNAASGASPAQLWLADGVSGTPPSFTLQTVTSGYAELAERLGCRQALARVAFNVKSAALQSDLMQIAQAEQTFRDIGLTNAKNSQLSVQWGVVNAAIGIGRYAGSALRTTVKMLESTFGGVTPTSLMYDAVFLETVALYSTLESKLLYYAPLAAQGVKSAETAQADANLEAKRIDALRTAAIARANEAQSAGLNP